MPRTKQISTDFTAKNAKIRVFIQRNDRKDLQTLRNIKLRIEEV